MPNKPLTAEETMVKNREVYYVVDKAGMPAQRVASCHPKLGLYVVRVSILMYEECQAVICCEWLNKMVEDRDFLSHGAKGICQLFKVTNYKGSAKTFIVVRKLLLDDLVSGIDEFVEVKQR